MPIAAKPPVAVISATAPTTKAAVRSALLIPAPSKLRQIRQAAPQPRRPRPDDRKAPRSEEHTSEPQSLMRISYAVFCLKKQKTNTHPTNRVHRLIKSNP